jgi:hypothetical protein
LGRETGPISSPRELKTRKGIMGILQWGKSEIRSTNPKQTQSSKAEMFKTASVWVIAFFGF